MGSRLAAFVSRTYTPQHRTRRRHEALVPGSLLLDPSGARGRIVRAGVAPRIFLKKLVADVLDRVDQFADFDPRQHYAPTIDEREMSVAERASAGAASVDNVEFEA